MNEKSLALGTFDGLHCGHLKVIEEAKKSKYDPYVLLFDVHPLSVINGKAPYSLMTDEKRDEVLNLLGVKALTVTFSEIVNCPFEEFFTEILLKKFNAKSLSCGENYTFGAGGKGDITQLKRLCEKHSVELHIAPTQLFDGQPVSSTRIRSLLENGEIEKANLMLSREFSYRFEVVDGDRRGRTLGFPTVNQFFPDNFVKLKFGVYASKCIIGSKQYPAVTNIGIRPTVKTDKYRSETYIIGYEGNLYGEKVEICLSRFLRNERKFESLEQLASAIGQDSEKSKEIFHNNPCNIG